MLSIQRLRVQEIEEIGEIVVVELQGGLENVGIIVPPVQYGSRLIMKYLLVLNRRHSKHGVLTSTRRTAAHIH